MLYGFVRIFTLKRELYIRVFCLVDKSARQAWAGRVYREVQDNFSVQPSKPARSAVGLLVYFRLNMYVRVHNICVCRFIDCIISVYISKVNICAGYLMTICGCVST